MVTPQKKSTYIKKAMSSRRKPMCFRSDIQRLLQAAEGGQKADLLTFSSGHLGPRSLNQTQPHKETKKSFWRTSQSLEDTANPPTPLQTKALHVKTKDLNECPSEVSAGAASVESEVSRSRRGQAAGYSSHAKESEDLPQIVDSLPVQSRAQKNSSAPEGNQRSEQRGLNNEDQLKTKQRFGRHVRAQQNIWAGGNVAEMHERKLQKELRRLSVQSRPSRDRLAVFSDVFDDVCEGSPVFGRILREIKSSDSSLKDLCSSKVTQTELEDAEKEVSRLEQEARGALEENQRVRNESQNVPAMAGPEDSDMRTQSQDFPDTSLSELQDGRTAIDSVQSKRLQVLDLWREIQQLEEEMKEMPVSSVTTTATETCIKDLKREIMRLIASNERLKTTNKDLEDNINMVLNREKASEAIRRMLWDEIHGDLQTE